MLQRYLFEALDTGAAAYRQNPALYAQLFGAPNGFCLSDDEVGEINAYFSQYPVQVRQGFGRRAIEDRPTFVIVLEGEQQSELFLGDYGGSSSSQDGAGAQSLTPLTTSIWSHSYQIRCLSQPKPQNTLYLYELGKACILAAKNNLAAYGVRQVVLSGSDLMVDGSKSPNTEYMRTLTVQCRREFAVSDSSGKLAQAFNIDGLSLPAPSVNTDGNPLTLVTAFDPDAE